jgi:hypothetical protein
MTRKLPSNEVNEKVEKPKRKRKATAKKEVKPKINHPEFGLKIEDKTYDIDTSLILCSNNGSDKKTTLHHARSKRIQRPILIEIDCEVPSYNIKNFSLTVDEARDMIGELQKMVDYLEEI